MIDPEPGEILRLPDGELVRFIEWEADGAEPRVARCEHRAGSVELYLPDQLEYERASRRLGARLNALSQLSQDVEDGYR